MGVEKLFLTDVMSSSKKGFWHKKFILYLHRIEIDVEIHL